MATAVTEPGFRELFTPKLLTILREGYGLREFRADVLAGLTVAIVALPLSMAIAIASGVTPDRGLYTSIVGGFIISALGGSRFQIGGPAGAFIVLVAATVVQHGLDGLLLATMLSGIMLAIVGLLRLGTFIKYIPYPVTIGFTAGIAIIILASQLKDLFGLSLEHEPGPLLPKLQALAGALPSLNPLAIMISAGTIAAILLVRRYRKAWPSFIIAVGAAAVLTALFGLPVDTIGSRFGGIPQSLPMPQLPAISMSRIMAVLPNAFSFALLGCIESLLSAVVADSMTGRRHRSNCELLAQGLANIASPLFGGICATGNIARTATNVRAGAHGPVAGMMHSIILLLFLLVAAPLASWIPLAALAGVLVMVAWNMVEKQQFLTLVRASRGDAAVLLITFLLVIFRDLSLGIIVGFALSTLLFIHRMAQAVEVEKVGIHIDKDRPDNIGKTGAGSREPYDASKAIDPDIVIVRVSGAFFFGAATAVAAALDRTGNRPRAYILDFSAVSMLDSTAAAELGGFVAKARSRSVVVSIVAATSVVCRTLLIHGVRPPQVRFHRTVERATRALQQQAKKPDN